MTVNWVVVHVGCIDRCRDANSDGSVRGTSAYRHCRQSSICVRHCSGERDLCLTASEVVTKARSETSSSRQSKGRTRWRIHKTNRHIQSVSSIEVRKNEISRVLTGSIQRKTRRWRCGDCCASYRMRRTFLTRWRCRHHN